MSVRGIKIKNLRDYVYDFSSDEYSESFIEWLFCHAKEQDTQGGVFARYLIKSLCNRADDSDVDAAMLKRNWKPFEEDKIRKIFDDFLKENAEEFSDATLNYYYRELIKKAI